MPDDQLATRLDAIAHVSGAESYLDRFEAGVEHAQRGFAVARATGQGQLFPVLLPAVNTSLCELGRLADAKELLDGGIEGARLAGNPQPLAWYLLSLAIVRMITGDLKPALAAADECIELCRGIDAGVIASYCRVMEGNIRIEAGDAQAGVATLVTSGGGPALPALAGGWRAWHLDFLARGLLALGRRDEAERAVAEAEALAAATGLRLASVPALRARARIALDAGDHATAAERALASTAGAGEVGARVEAALSRTLAGRALAAAGDADRAAGELQVAADELDACGARRYRDEAERELGRLGLRPHRRSRRGTTGGTGVESLTARELEVARLIVDRRTNPEIAAELYLSPKTVETHVGHLFQKLDVSSRVEVARVVERLDR
jgi:DNA-binding NarL/FixJ family response regulator